uniref:Suaeda glauca jasmonate-induced protein mRNA n=1 Tax=Suaeda glauca TaxID=397272 RepID=A0A0C5AU63_9CARY|nr:jasmonate-induced protein [Suaeda glauca]
MASVQQAQGVAQFNDKEKAAIQKAINEARNFVANNDNAKPTQEQLVKVTGVMTNAQSRTIMHDKTHEWKGHFIVKPPNTIGGKTTGDHFVHMGANWQGQLPVVVGSKAAVVYITMDKMHPGLGYLLAWDKPENSSNGTSKIYVEAGNSAKFVKMDWNEIEKKLDASCNTSFHFDPETGAMAGGEIKDSDKNATIGAIFDRRGA